MRKLYFLLPGTTDKFACGGLWAELKTLQLVQQVCPAEVVTYRQREKGHLWLDDLLQSDDNFRALDDVIFVMSWGFDVAKLAPKLKSLNAIYHAHSAGYGFNLPASVPIITVSRNTLGYWGQRSPHSLLYYLPNEISPKFVNRQPDQWGDRDIDVLVQARKSSSYLMHQLIPALQKKCRVEVIDRYVEDLEALFNRAKVYLYDSAEYWAVQGVSEGFGLQPMEALACGCQVFSSVNHGLSDYLDPAFNCYKIAGYSQEFDVQRVLKVLDNDPKLSLSPSVLAEYRSEHIIQRLWVILEDLNTFFDHRQLYPKDIPDLGYRRIIKMRSQKLLTKLKKLFNSLK
ncbi:glycosyltransferase [Pseudanabaena sp. FACHB-1998]|uniref:glycosyltransferase n=1 Tax=Pseudanabaena sp. FACHB-1998 TaxID=2692858 RepID=UPI0016806994|nr:glycosyltransferase [Pseudanabaena sp. FACHB-1998]MBD2176078.1 glycosyltransferase [Pseudanabaena sp. FACHB-1998]